MNDELIKLADYLDKRGYHEEAGYIDKALRKNAGLWKWFLRGARATPAGIMSAILWETLTPAATAADNDCRYCYRQELDWSYDQLNDKMDLSQWNSEAEWPEPLKKIIRDLGYDNCCSCTEEEFQNHISEQAKQSFVFKLNQLRINEDMRELFWDWIIRDEGLQGWHSDYWTDEQRANHEATGDPNKPAAGL